MIRSLIAAALYLSAIVGADAGSTINPALPSQSAPLASAPVRGNFAAAYNDVTNILGMYRGSVAPGNPVIGQDWLDTTSSPAIWKKRYSTGWTALGTINLTTGAVVFTPSAISIRVGSTLISGGTTTRVLYDNAGVVGEYAVSGTGSVAMTNTPILVTPVLGAATGTTLALGGCSLSGSVLCATGSGHFTTDILVDGSVNLGNSSLIDFGTGSIIANTGDGMLRLSNNAQSSFSRLQFGGTDNTHPALAPYSSNGLQVIAADNSGNTPFLASSLLSNSVVINGCTLGGSVICGAGTASFASLKLNSQTTGGLPTAMTGTLIQAGQANGVVARVELDAYGAIAAFTGVSYGGTAASPTAITSGTQLTGVNAYAYNGASAVGPIASFRTYAAENIASGHQGSKACIATTANASTTLTDQLCVNNDGGIAVVAGPVSVPVGSASAPSINFGTANTGIYGGSGLVSFSVGGSLSLAVDSAGIENIATRIGWANGTIISSDSTNLLAQRNGTNGQTYLVYNTYTDGSNYERIDFGWSTNVAKVRSTAAGTGTVRQLQIGTAGNANLSFFTGDTVRWAVDGATGALFPAGTSNTLSIGSAAQQVSTLFVGLVEINQNVLLYGDEAGFLAQRNGTNPQGQYIFGTYTNASNYERLRSYYDGGAYNISTQALGTGTARDLYVGTEGNSGLYLRTNATNRWFVQAGTGHFMANIDNTYDIGASGATRPRNIYSGTDIKAGGSFFALGGGSGLYFNTFGSLLTTGSDGVAIFSNNAGSGWTRLILGTNDASGISIKKNGTAFNFRTGNDGANADVKTGSLGTNGQDPGTLGATGLSVGGSAAASSTITAAQTVAIPAGGTQDAGFLFSSTAHFGSIFGSGAPTASMAQGTIYQRSDGGVGTRLYVNTNGTTGYVALADVNVTTLSSLSTVGTLTSGTLALSSLSYTGTLAGANVASAADTSGSPSATFGVVKCDGTTITCLSGVISAVGGVATSVGVGTTTITSGTPGRVLYDNTTLGELASLTGSSTAITVVSASLVTSGNISAAAWTTSGIRRKASAASYTDTSSSGTVAAAYTDLSGVSTILASSSTTYTNYYGSYFQDPVASTNVTMTNKWALGADSLQIGTSNPFKVSTAGAVTIQGTFTATGLIGLANLATQAADTLLANATGGAASPTAVTIGSCSAASSALTYNTSTHAFGCNTISAAGLTSAVFNTTRLISASSGSVGYTGCGFQPTAIQITTNDNSQAGFWGSSTSYSDSTKAVRTAWQTISAVQVAGGVITTIGFADAAGTSAPATSGQTATITSYDSTGFTLSWTKNGSPAGSTVNLSVVCYK